MRTVSTPAGIHLDRSHEEKIKLSSEISDHSAEDTESIMHKHDLAGKEVIEACSREQEET